LASCFGLKEDGKKAEKEEKAKKKEKEKEKKKRTGYPRKKLKG